MSRSTWQQFYGVTDEYGRIIEERRDEIAKSMGEAPDESDLANISSTLGLDHLTADGFWYTSLNRAQYSNYGRMRGGVYVNWGKISFTQGGGNWPSNFWNSLGARVMIPDIIHIGVGFTGIAGTGTGTSFELNWIVRGTNASFIPILTTTITPGVGYQTDATINFGGYRYLGPANDLKKAMLITSIIDKKAGGFISIGGSAIGKISFTGTITPTKAGYGLLQTEVNIGLGLLPGVNGAIGASNTYIIPW